MAVEDPSSCYKKRKSKSATAKNIAELVSALLAFLSFYLRLTGVVGDECHVNSSPVSWDDDNVAPDRVGSAERVRRVRLFVGRGDVGGYTGDLELMTVDMEGVLWYRKGEGPSRVENQLQKPRASERRESRKKGAHSVSVVVDDHQINYISLLENDGMSLRSVGVGVSCIDSHRELGEERRSVGHDVGL